MKKTKINIILIKLILISLATAPSFALGEDNRNLLLIGVMAFSPVIIFAAKGFYKSDVWLITLMISLMLFPFLNHPESMRWSTVLYSWMFCLTFMAYNRLLHKNYFSVHQFHNLIKFTIIAYLITLLVQQFCVLTGLPIFNLSNYDIKEPWKLNSLSAEPSHSGRIVAILFYCFIFTKESLLKRKYNLKIDTRKDRWIWFAFLYTMITMGSATALFFIFIVLIKFVKKKNLLPFSVAFIIILTILIALDIKAIERIVAIFKATVTLNPNAIVEADHSASFRIAPILIMATMVEIFSIDGLFGHGIDSVSEFLYLYMPGAGEDISGGGFFYIWYEYGLISFLLLLIFTLKSALSTFNISNFIFWFFLVFLYGINNQMVWLCIILLFTNNFFHQKRDNTIKLNLKNYENMSNNSW